MATGNFLTDEKLLIVGAGGMIGSNMAQIAAMLRLTPNICLYDVYEPGNNGVLLEMQHSAFPRMRFIATTDPKEAFTGATRRKPSPAPNTSFPPAVLPVRKV